MLRLGIVVAFLIKIYFELYSIYPPLGVKEWLTYIMLLFLVQRLELLIWVDLWEHPLVVEDFKRSDPWVTAVFEDEQVCLIVHLLHLNWLVVARRLRTSSSLLTFAIFYFLVCAHTELTNLLGLIVLRACQVAILFKLLFGHCSVQQWLLVVPWSCLPYSNKNERRKIATIVPIFQIHWKITIEQFRNVPPKTYFYVWCFKIFLSAASLT